METNCLYQKYFGIDKLLFKNNTFYIDQDFWYNFCFVLSGLVSSISTLFCKCWQLSKQTKYQI